MAKRQKRNDSNNKKPIEQYEHKDKQRTNNPPVGLVTPDTDQTERKKTYSYDPHLDPQLMWTGKAERTSFEVPTVSLHVHERIDPRSIIEAVRKKNGKDYEQMSFFNDTVENPPLRDAIDFYKHKHNWSNRLIAGDSLQVMNSLIEKEGLAGQVQMIYIDPPYGIRYGSNFQPFVNKRDVKDGKDEDVSQEPEMLKAFRDTWELGIHSYLSYLRDRLLLARELLTESGSVFVQISDENVHHVKELLDEIFDAKNQIAVIPFRKKTMPFGAKYLEGMNDYLLFYSKNKTNLKYKQLYLKQNVEGLPNWTWVEMPDGKVRKLSEKEHNAYALLPKGSKVFRAVLPRPSGYSKEMDFEVHFEGKKYRPPKNGCWVTTQKGMENLIKQNRIFSAGDNIYYKLYFEDFPVTPLTGFWNDMSGQKNINYIVQTLNTVIQRCLLMATDPGDLVFDPTCGSGTTAYVAEQWGRRWITCDTSRVAITLAKQRLMTALYDYYELAYPEQGIGSGFRYKTVPHKTLGSIANNEPPAEETLYDQPYIDSSKTRVTGPFTVEAVPSQVVKPLDEEADTEQKQQYADNSIARMGETLRQAEWRDELLKSGIRGKAGQYITFSRVESLPGTKWLHAEAETIPNDKGADKVKEPEVKSEFQQPQRAVISFGPEHSPLEQRQVALAIEGAQNLVPKPKLIIFASFHFDPEASKDIDELNWPGVTVLKAQMNTDLLTEDLKKKRSSNESYWLIGQPDITLKNEKVKKGEEQTYTVEVHGFDYFNTKTGELESGGKNNIAMWMLDTDYDGRSLFPRQVFFPMAGPKDGWSKLAKNLKAEIDEELIEQYRGTVSLPFKPSTYGRIAVKIVDDRGIESLKIINL